MPLHRKKHYDQRRWLMKQPFEAQEKAQRRLDFFFLRHHRSGGCRCHVVFPFQKPQHRQGCSLFSVSHLVDLFRSQIRSAPNRQDERLGNRCENDIRPESGETT